MGPDGKMILEPASLTVASTKMLETHEAQAGLKLFKEGINDTKFQEKQKPTVLGAS